MLLDHKMADYAADLVAASVMSWADPLLKLIKCAMEAMWEAAEGTRVAVDRLHNMCEEARDEMQKVAEVMKDEMHRERRPAAEEMCHGSQGGKQGGSATWW